MRKFEILDAAHPDKPPCAYLTCDQSRGAFSVELADWTTANDLPLTLAPFAEVSDRVVPDEWAKRWVEERIVPPSRQNIGQVLRAHGIDEYDECELLAQSGGRCAQDDFYVREITKGFKGAALVGRQVMRARVAAGLSQSELASRCGIRQETLSRIERGSVNPTTATLEAIAEALDMRLEIGFSK